MDLSIVFDLDGTLITCENKQKYVLYSILSRFSDLNLEIIDEWWTLKRNGYNTESALSKIGTPNAKTISNEWRKTIEDFTWCYLDKPFNDTIQALKSIKENNDIKIFILTARKSKLQPLQAIYRFGLSSLIEDIVIVNPLNAVNEKSFFLSNCKPVMFIGDTESDYEASINSDTRFVALSRGQRSNDFLKKSGIQQIENNLNFLQHSDKFFRS